MPIPPNVTDGNTTLPIEMVPKIDMRFVPPEDTRLNGRRFRGFSVGRGLKRRFRQQKKQLGHLDFYVGQNIVGRGNIG